MVSVWLLTFNIMVMVEFSFFANSLNDSLSCLAPLSAHTATMQSPLIVKSSLVVISRVVLCVAEMFGWPRACIVSFAFLAKSFYTDNYFCMTRN